MIRRINNMLPREQVRIKVLELDREITLKMKKLAKINRRKIQDMYVIVLEEATKDVELA